MTACTVASDAVLPWTATPTETQMTNVTAVKATTTGTNKDATLSTSSCIFGLESFASSTMAAMVVMVLSPGRRVRRTANVPEPLMVPAITCDLAYFSTGRDSPVTNGLVDL